MTAPVHRPRTRAGERLRVSVWEDVPAERAQLGVRVWASGAELVAGRRVWRLRWWVA